MFANGIPLTTKSGSPDINLNNMQGSGKSGPSRVVELVVSLEQKKQILEKNPEEITLTYGCALPDCHSDPAHITIINTAGQVLLPGIFVTTGGLRMSSSNPPKTILKLNKCGEKIWAATAENMYDFNEKPKPKVRPFFTDAMNDDGLMKLYELIGADGTFKIPEDQKDYFSKYKELEGKTWEQVMDALAMPGYRKREFRRKIENNQ
jgi:hypothetical protein